MRKNTYKILSVMALFVLSFTSCQDYLDVNNDPNNPNDASMDLVLPVGQASVAVQVGGSFFNLGGYWAQYYAQSPDAAQYENFEEYNITDDFFDREWTDMYAGGINDLQVVRDQAMEADNGSYYLIATLMQAYAYQVLVDLYGKIPYSEALQGAAETPNFNPKFDDGQAVYAGLLADIDAALDMYAENPGDAPSSNDLIYGGDMAQWVAFANSLKLKIHMRQSNTANASAQAIEALVADGNFITQDAKMVAWAAEVNKANPYYEVQIDRLGGVNQAASNTMVKYLLDTEDPRIDKFYKKGSTGQWVAKEQGDFENRDIPFGELAQPIATATTPVYLMTVAEVNFLVAEAALRFGGGAGAQAAYEAGIDASCAMHGVSSSGLYGSGEVYEWNDAGTTDEKWEQIMMQKWVSLCNTQNLEAFFEINRTGWPEFAETDSIGDPGQLTISIATVLPPGKTAKRLLFPNVERARNTNTPDQPAGGIGAPLWWQKQ